MRGLKGVFLTFIVFTIGIFIPACGWISLQLARPDMSLIWLVLWFVSSQLTMYGAVKYVLEL